MVAERDRRWFDTMTVPEVELVPGPCLWKCITVRQYSIPHNVYAKGLKGLGSCKHARVHLMGKHGTARLPQPQQRSAPFYKLQVSTQAAKVARMRLVNTTALVGVT